MQLRATTTLWPHQEMALRAICTPTGFKSGILVVPCGGGKTLIGILLCSLLPAKILILCHNCNSVLQWKAQLVRWTCPRRRIYTCTSGLQMESLEEADIVIMTYKMLSNRNAHNIYAQHWITAHVWSGIIYDEVHGTPADMVEERVLQPLQGKVKIGATATPTGLQPQRACIPPDE